MQDFFAILIVVLAAAYLVRCGWQRVWRRPIGGCHSCSTCAAGSGPPPLVSISPRFTHPEPGERRVSSK